MPRFIETYRGAVAAWECDEFGHMNVQFYTARMSDGFWQLLTALGMGPGVRRERQIGIVAIDNSSQYRREVRAGELIRVESAPVEIGEKSVVLQHRLLSGESGELAFTSTAKSVCFDLKARRSMPFPPDIRATIEALVAGADMAGGDAS